MNQEELLKKYALKVTKNLRKGQNFVKYSARRHTIYGTETMYVEVTNYEQYVCVVYYYEGCNSYVSLPRRHYASVYVKGGYAYDFLRGEAFTYFPDLDRLLENLHIDM